MPCTTPGTPWPTAAPPAGSTPTSSTLGSSTKPEKMPMALEPPPTQATTTSGSAAESGSSTGPRASSPITRWSSRTIHGYGCGPITEPRQ